MIQTPLSQPDYSPAPSLQIQLQAKDEQGQLLHQGSLTQLHAFQMLSPDEQALETKKHQIRQLQQRQSDLKAQISHTEASKPGFDPFLRNTEKDLETTALAESKIGVLKRSLFSVETALKAAVEAHAAEIECQRQAPILNRLSELANEATVQHAAFFQSYLATADILTSAMQKLEADFEAYETSRVAFETEASKYINLTDAEHVQRLKSELREAGANLTGVEKKWIGTRETHSLFFDGSREDFGDLVTHAPIRRSTWDGVSTAFLSRLQGK